MNRSEKGRALSSATFPINTSATSTPYPRIDRLAGDRLIVSYAVDVSPRFFVHGRRTVVESTDAGETWTQCDAPEVPANWWGSSTREMHDRVEFVLPDGTWMTTGAVGWQAWDVAERPRAEAEGRYVTPDPPAGQPELIGVGTNTLFVQRSTDRGARWHRREIELPAAGWTLGLPRNIRLADGTFVLPLRQRSQDAAQGQVLIARVTIGADFERVRVHAVPRDLAGRTGSEAAVAEIAPDQLVMLIRADTSRGGTGEMLKSWSEDGGRSWTLPVGTKIEGWPPHLLSLADGRLLCTYGHHQPPYGVRAVLSADGGETWSTTAPLQLADLPDQRGGAFHPMSVQLADGSIYTVYYDSSGTGCDALGTRWSLPEA